MANRVNKSGTGQPEFAVAAAVPATLRVSELDADLDAIFGNITNANIATGANIATAKLASDLGIVSGMIAANAITTSKIADQNVTSAKLATNATGPALSSGQITPGLATQNTTNTLVTLSPISTHGGRVLIFGTVSGLWTITTAASIASWDLLRDGAPITFGLIDSRWGHHALAVGADVIQIPGAFSVLFLDTTATGTLSVPVAHTYALQLTVTPATGATFTTDGTAPARPGFLFALELA
jgi:hypothetical protein